MRTGGIVERLDRGSGRWLLGAAYTVRLSLRERQPVVVRPAEDLWLCRRPDHTMVTKTRVFRGRRGYAPVAHELLFHDYEPRPGDTVVDLGGGLGEEVVEMARLVGPGGRVHVFEADPTTYRGLRLTVDRNRLENVRTYPIGVSEHNGVIALYPPDDGSMVGLKRAGAGDALLVGAVRLDEWMDLVGLDHVDLLKMNIEGAELDALRGLGDHLQRVDHLCIECHDFQADAGRAGPEVRTRVGVVELLDTNGFDVTLRLEDPRTLVQHYVYASRRSAD